MSKIICLDAGHGGKTSQGGDSGACANGFMEKDLNLPITQSCRDYLKSRGYNVIMTRDSDVPVGINERARISNNANASLFISVHNNAGGGNGCEAIHSIYGTEGRDLAQAIVDSIHNCTGQNKRNRPIFTRTGEGGNDYFGVIRETICTAVIVECAFMDSNDIEIVNSPQKQASMGIAVAKGILNYLGHKEVIKTPNIAIEVHSVEKPVVTLDKPKEEIKIELKNPELIEQLIKVHEEIAQEQLNMPVKKITLWNLFKNLFKE